MKMKITRGKWWKLLKKRGRKGNSERRGNVGSERERSAMDNELCIQLLGKIYDQI